jgi:hypothetical protein
LVLTPKSGLRVERGGLIFGARAGSPAGEGDASAAGGDGRDGSAGNPFWAFVGGHEPGVAKDRLEHYSGSEGRERGA